ncbi:helix-turn-helix transcriptional regulator [Clostridium botulinum]|nr:helix-turn-helix transcriptional regulator [Clostridium botulinum]NFI55879.1 helix-turn-helix transcriptional regulator [Clostridium botulinum]NFK66354.1 helix-turn-helix transcriptional regulator [Clostridium botulinum]NFK69459.1 helix-turn-helix transcriptional regulator [Clostridium botulinum]NFK97933.1 helix-turn-helix transcriptional regulator [Clostridium botulinum]
MMNLIRKQRIKNKMSQEELAKLCKIKQSQISRIETNKELPSAKLIVELADNLNLCYAEAFCHFYGKDNCKKCESYKYKHD